MTAVTPRAAYLSSVAVGGTSVVSMFGPLTGGAIIVNPYAATDQGITTVEPLYLSLVGPAALVANASTFAIQPGGVFVVPPGFGGSVWVNAASNGHAFSAIAISDVAQFIPFSGAFPPSGPTTVTKTIPAYLYQEYNDDDDLQAFFASFNALAQVDVDWFVDIELPVYPGLFGTLLDFVVAGLYGMLRPALPAGRNANVGPLNTWTPNLIPLNTIKQIGNQTFVATSDDVFKRILTWHFYKGDGKTFTVPWLKRRVVRFLEGPNGLAPNIDQTYRVSVTFGPGRQVNINLAGGRRTLLGGCLPNRFGPNSHTPLNSLVTSFVAYPGIPLGATFKAAVESGALELPFQYTYAVNIT